MVTLHTANMELSGKFLPFALCSFCSDKYISISCLFKGKVSLDFGTVCKLSIKATSEEDS